MVRFGCEFVVFEGFLRRSKLVHLFIGADVVVLVVDAEYLQCG